MKTLLKGGTVVSAAGSRVADVLVDGEKIAAVGEGLAVDGAKVVDVRGKLLFPGFIDAHTHFDLDVCNTTTADDFESGSKSAIRGGTTTVIDFACPNKGESLAYGLDLWHKKADGKCYCDYGFHMTIDDWNESIESELDAMFDAGITSFKVYRALKALKVRGGIAGVHCENAGVIDARIAELKASGLGADVVSHPISRPDYLEAEAVSRLLRIAQAADAPVIIVHTTNRASLDEIAAARRRGQTVYVETCPQYLALDDVCAPPIRSQEDSEALWKALRRGEVQTISTDHCSFTLEQKDMGRDDFTKIPGGLPGVETRGEVVYTVAINENKLSLGGVCRALSENPAKLYGLYPRKGVIAAGSDADIVVYDPGASHVLHGADMLSKAGYTPFEGFRTNGGVSKVYLRGQLQVDGGKVVGGKMGEYLKRGKCAL